MARTRSLLHATVATMKRARDLLAGHASPQRDVLLHKHAAMTLLHERIATDPSAVSEDDVLAMLFLALLEVSLGDKQAYKIHRAQVDRLICAEGGIQSSVYLQTTVKQYVLTVRETSSSDMT
jgi:hypothetical protein